MVEWIISNKEWIFSGLGIAIISAFFAILKTNLTEEKQQSNIKIVDISLNEDKEFIVDINIKDKCSRLLITAIHIIKIIIFFLLICGDMS